MTEKSLLKIIQGAYGISLASLGVAMYCLTSHAH